MILKCIQISYLLLIYQNENILFYSEFQKKKKYTNI